MTLFERRFILSENLIERRNRKTVVTPQHPTSGTQDIRRQLLICAARWICDVRCPVFQRAVNVLKDHQFHDVSSASAERLHHVMTVPAAAARNTVRKTARIGRNERLSERSRRVLKERRAGYSRGVGQLRAHPIPKVFNRRWATKSTGRKYA